MSLSQALNQFAQNLGRYLSIVLWDCFERKSAENDMEGLDFRSTSAPPTFPMKAQESRFATRW